MMNKLLPCEYPECNQSVQMRSTIKNPDSEYRGLRVCPRHANQEKAPKQKSDQNRRTEAARKEQRKDYPEFYQKMIELCQGKKCAETGDIINVPSSVNIVHILAKSTSPEVATNSDNILFMKGDAHSKFDSSLEARRGMLCFLETLDRYEKLKPLLKNITAETKFYDECLYIWK